MIVSLPLYIGLNFFQSICGFIYFQVLSLNFAPYQPNK